MALERLKGLIADGMLHPAGVLRRHIRVNAQPREQLGQSRVAFVYLFRNPTARLTDGLLKDM